HEVIGQLAALDFAGVAVEADVGDPMLAAGVGAAANVDLQAADERVVVFASVFGEGGAEVHGLGQRQVAAIGAGAGDGIADFIGAVAGQADFFEGGVNALERAYGHVGERHVLSHGHADETVGGPFGEIGEGVHLGAGQITVGDFYRDDGIAGLLLRAD